MLFGVHVYSCTTDQPLAAAVVVVVVAEAKATLDHGFTGTGIEGLGAGAGAAGYWAAIRALLNRTSCGGGL